MGGGDISQELIAAAFTPDNQAVLFAYRKADRPTLAQSVPLPAKLVATPAAKGSFAWDKPLDPKGKCKFQDAGGKLTIVIPHGNYNVWPRGEMAAPRLLGDVAGDFTAQVRVGGKFPR